MKEVTSYQDSAGGLHTTAKECMEREIVIRLGRFGLSNSTAIEVSKHSEQVQKIISEIHKQYTNLTIE